MDFEELSPTSYKGVCCLVPFLLKVACASFSKFNFLMNEDEEGGGKVVILHPISVNVVDFFLLSKFLSN